MINIEDFESRQMINVPRLWKIAWLVIEKTVDNFICSEREVINESQLILPTQNHEK
ncbi:hypothetical protein SAMN05216302_102440 [Nitrosomonas aestuarii]|uniref:Uncharacterized protein n=1 Tax=Nitrosomonas aestuarii TaxID=52441 RepID=A0A1I4E2Z5_9PROT|nr:hypothetical protein [Nitrosomonas aestuarii]SFK98551.1 hypothetical protein SAMN05216302_102440 [Nitrosomonas aestuarii]